jgi:molecular chaperone DnaK
MPNLSAGIDLGTTNSCLAVLEGGRPKVVPNDLNAPITPSLVSIRPEGPIVGKKARRYLLTDPASTFASIKRRMGERYTRDVAGKSYTPESVSALILKHLKTCAEQKVEGPIEDVVITVPANFNSIQRQATKDAGEIAGFRVLRVLNEPTAAALAYGQEKKLSSIMVVFDLGGGTFDISVVEASGDLYEVIHSHGDNHLGGDDFNMRILNWITQEFAKKSGRDIRREVEAVQLAQEWAIAAKHSLTDAPEVQVRIPKLSNGEGFDAILTRAMYEEMCSDLFDRLRAVARSVMDALQQPRFREAYPGAFENGMQGCDILLVGGETRVPAVRELVTKVFKGTIHTDVNPDEVVALGAAVQAGIIQKQGDVGNIVLVDTTALSLGTEVKGGLFSKIVEANTPIPCSRTGEYSPVEDMQSSVLVKIFQGESELCEKNVKLGEFEFRLSPPRPRLDATIQLTYHLDANDILHVSAVDKKTGAKQEMTVKGSQNLDRATVEKMKKEALENQAKDHARARRIDRDQRLRAFAAEALTHARSLAAKDPKNKFVAKAEEYAIRLEKALVEGNDGAIEDAARDLEGVWQKLLSALPPGAPLATPQGAASGEAAAADDMTTCANCGARVSKGFAFCGKCGVALKKDACGACGAALVEGFAFCGRCGAKV